MSGVWPPTTEGDVTEGTLPAEAVRRCLERYEAERGRVGFVEVPLGETREDLRLTSGVEGAEVAGERWDGGV